MLIKYLGPSPEVNVGQFGSQRLGEAKEYPDNIGRELIETAKKQRFEAAEALTDAVPSPEGMNVEQLKAELGNFYDAPTLKGLKKADLIALFNTTRADLQKMAPAA